MIILLMNFVLFNFPFLGYIEMSSEEVKISFICRNYRCSYETGRLECVYLILLSFSNFIYLIFMCYFFLLFVSFFPCRNYPFPFIFHMDHNYLRKCIYMCHLRQYGVGRSLKIRSILMVG